MSESSSFNHKTCEKIRCAKEHRTHVDGTFYQMPQKFPCVLHDRNGCLFLTNEHYKELVALSTIHESTGGKQAKINISDSIAKISGYERCINRKLCPKYNAKID